MATIELSPLSAHDSSAGAPARLLTAADLEAFPTDLPSGPIDYELDDGRLVLLMAPPGDDHGSLQFRLGAHLFNQGEFKNHGQGWTDVGLILSRDPDRVLSPDVAFVASKSLPIRRSSEGYLETIPQLVVEIRSKNDSLPYVRRKLDHYLKAGVEVVWLVDPQAKTVTVHRGAEPPIAYGVADVLELPGIIPDFSLPVADVFRD